MGNRSLVLSVMVLNDIKNLEGVLRLSCENMICFYFIMNPGGGGLSIIFILFVASQSNLKKKKSV